MSKEMEVILIQDRKKLGKFGERKKVKRGFALNYLVPQGIAMIVNKDALNQLKALEKKEGNRREKEKTESEDIKSKIDGQTLTIEEKSHDEGKLFGSVTPSDVASEINKSLEVVVKKDDLKMPAHIKEVGEYEIKLELPQDMEASFKLIIESPEED